MPDQARLSDVVHVRDRFLRSVHLDRDFATDTAGGYHLTECSYRALDAILGALDRPAQRALTVVGPYGSGKSAFCVKLAQLLEKSPTSGFLGNGHKVPETSQRLLPVLLVGARQPLAPALVRGLWKSLKERGYHHILARLKNGYDSTLSSGNITPRAVADLYREAACLARLEGADGILLVIDELGKLLEYAAQYPGNSDIFVLQEMAEAAARSGEHPLLLVTVLHQHVETYAQKLGRTHQAEWTKVGERFHQIPFFPSDLEGMEMLGRALRHDPRLGSTDRMDDLSQMWLNLDVTHSGLRSRFLELARAAYPLHPVTLLALPTLFRKSGQSNRSLFTFLAGEDAQALGPFLRNTPYVPGRSPLFMPDRLFDYAADVLVGGWSASSVTRSWMEAVEMVERTIHISSQTHRVLKVIALLGILKDPRLPATRSVLELALTDAAGTPPQVEEALAELTQNRLAVYSRRRGIYRIWEGGDIDIEAEIAAVRSKISPHAATQLAAAVCLPGKLVARRHSYRTGTLRTVTARPCAALDLVSAVNSAGSSLHILIALARDPEEAEQAERAARKTSQPNLLFGTAVETSLLREASTEVAAADIVQRDTKELQNDRAARRELAARRSEAEIAFNSEWARLFGPHTGGATWCYQGQEIRFVNVRSWSEILSQMADSTYNQAPSLRNELINRHGLSSTTAAARRNLLEAMLTHTSEPRLGIKGYPPESSVYECLLHATGLHYEVAPATWSFRSPLPDHDPAGLLPCWNALDAIIFALPPQTYSVQDLFRILSAPPYGLTEGVLPVLLCAFLLANAEETSLYRDRTFLPDPAISDWEVLLRRPELFAVAGSRVSGERALVVERLARGLKTAPAVVPVVRALLRMTRALPDYARKTRRLPDAVIALRLALDKAQSPERLLFFELPLALGITIDPEQEVGPENIEEFFRRLNASLHDWSEAMPRIIQQTRDRLLEACGFPSGGDGWTSLREQSRLMRERVTHPTLLPILNRAAASDDDPTALDGVLSLLAERLPRTWADADVDRAQKQAQFIGELFRSVATEVAVALDQSLSEADIRQSQALVETFRAQVPGDVPPSVLRAALLALLRDLALDHQKEGSVP